MATSAIRRDGATKRLIPLAYPAAADWRVAAALVDAVAAEPDLPWGTGTVLSEGTFYKGPLPSEMEMWAAAGAPAVEMEHLPWKTTVS